MRFTRFISMRSKRSRKTEGGARSLEERVAHLESMIEGLQDAVHRDSVRTDARLEELRKQLEPSELSRALSEEQRRRGT
jgi:uncharacterized coiled-coil protein SlyX